MSQRQEAGAGAAAAPGAERVLETELIGPAARGPRSALRAIAFYASSPAAPGSGPVDRAAWGMGQVLRAARLVVADRALRRAALVPTALTFAGCAALAALATWTEAASGEGAELTTTFHAFLITFVGLASMPPTLLQRMWLRVAREARRALGLSPGEDPFEGVGYLRLAARESGKALRQAVVVSAGLFPVLAVIRLLPFGRTEAAVLAGTWAFYWIVVDAFELPIEILPGPRGPAPEPWFARLLRAAGAASRLLRPFGWTGRLLARLTRPWSHEARFTELHPAETVGLGLAVGALLAVPGVGLFFRSVAIVAATALHASLEEGPRGAPGEGPR